MDLSQASPKRKVSLLLACQGETNSAPHFSMPMALIASPTPSFSNSARLAGSSDSPM